MILLVEDNRDDVDLTLRAFAAQDFGATIEVVEDGADALARLLGEDPTKPLPELILLDLNLPRMDGLDVLRALRGDPRTSLIPVVVLTSSTEDQDVVESYRLGANSYVRKPVSYDDFLEATRTLGAYWLALNHPPPRPRGRGR